MIAAIDILIVTVVFVAGFIGGRISKHAAPVTNPAFCTCGHPRGFHRDGKGRCQHEIPTNFIRAMDQGKDTCGCLIWDGPERPEDVVRGFQG